TTTSTPPSNYHYLRSGHIGFPSAVSPRSAASPFSSAEPNEGIPYPQTPRSGVSSSYSVFFNSPSPQERAAGPLREVYCLNVQEMNATAAFRNRTDRIAIEAGLLPTASSPTEYVQNPIDVAVMEEDHEDSAGATASVRSAEAITGQREKQVTTGAGARDSEIVPPEDHVAMKKAQESCRLLVCGSRPRPPAEEVKEPSSNVVLNYDGTPFALDGAPSKSFGASSYILSRFLGQLSSAQSSPFFQTGCPAKK
ncbi:unnamed protein product, partial [Amoebophrya sp. A25]